MKALEDKILKEGKVFPGGILKVSGFLNHRLDVGFLMEMGEEIARIYKGCGVNKILTVEASGIAIAVCAASKMGVPVVFAKKGMTSNLQSEVYSVPVKSFTHGMTYSVTVSKEYLSDKDSVLIVDDFLANGNAMKGLVEIVRQAGGKIIGCTAAIEKEFQGGGNELRSEGLRVESLAVIEKMTDTEIIFGQ